MTSVETLLLHESAPGLLLLRVKEWDTIAQDADAVIEATLDATRFKQIVEYVGFHPFSDAEEALETMMGVASGVVPNTMKKFLELHIPADAGKASKSSKASKKAKRESESAQNDQNANFSKAQCAIGVCDPALGKSLGDLGYQVVFNPNILELHRGCRTHLKKIAKQLKELPISKFQVGLGHSYSRQLMQVDPRKQDKPIMQSIALIDSLEKNVNSFAMKLKEWYGWHFPELVKIVGDTEMYCKALLAIKKKDEFEETGDMEALLEAVAGDESVRDEIIAATRHSMGQDISNDDFVNIERFAQQVLSLCIQRRTLQEYLSEKMEFVSPNLKAVVGEVLGARLISHAGALVNLAKYPASTVQILGAEKALFRALKARSGRTPKYGLLFNSTFIGRVKQANHRGRMSRYLASKCSLAARIDAFSEDSPDGKRSHIFGDKLREQLEERLLYLADGVVPRKNLLVMREAMQEVQVDTKKRRKAAKKAAKLAEAGLSESNDAADVVPSKKKKQKDLDVQDMDIDVDEKPSKKKKKQAALRNGDAA